MDEFRWIQMFSCLMLMIRIAAFSTVSLNETSIFMKVGDDVTLPCLNLIDQQNNCDGTTWTFASRNKPTTIELITLGQIGEHAKTKSDRLSVTANCSVLIKKLKVEDVGFYSCQQYKVKETPSKHTRVRQSFVDLSVITLTEHKNIDKGILNCSVLTHGECHHTVMWQIKGKDVDKEDNEIVTSQTVCSTTVSIPESHFLYSSRYNILACEVTDSKIGKVQLFTFTSQPSGEETDFSVSLRSIIISVGLAATLITAVTVNIWTRTKGNTTKMDKTIHYDQDEDDVTIHYENIGVSAASVRFN
ncbi:uncharacterized protein LOC120433122 isoform X3 [Oreochromis aureus]|uniref:uncharacterized protein LOC120433122 isoform X3 n=1 Tax=Oreochromis aureus TaxID=47969 RepID=UPI0019544FBC|nr:uncharacterized protein LOC120433122 isoform X3 [Oreochromis aureus]